LCSEYGGHQNEGAESGINSTKSQVFREAFPDAMKSGCHPDAIARETRARKFPTICASWNKPNLEIRILSVNAAGRISWLVRFIEDAIHENGAKMTQTGLLKENSDRASS